MTNDDSPKEMEETILEKTNFPTFEESLRAAADGAPPSSESRYTVVVSRRKFQVLTENGWQQLPEGTFLGGQAEFADSLPVPERQFQRDSDNGRPPTVGPTPEDQVPIIRGGVFGRDRTVAIIAHIISTDGDSLRE